MKTIKVEHQQGVCPCCNGQILEYYPIILESDAVGYPWVCTSCQSTGVEWHNLTFDGHDRIVSKITAKE